MRASCLSEAYRLAGRRQEARRLAEQAIELAVRHGESANHARALRMLAERQGSDRLKRPIHIGALKLRLMRGRVEVDDFSIEGLAPTDRPFFAAARLSVPPSTGADPRRSLRLRGKFIRV